MGVDVQEYISLKNYQLLKKNHPNVLAELEKMDVTPLGEIVTGPGGLLNLKLSINDSPVFLHPEHDPESGRHLFLSSISETFSGVEIFFGMGLGYEVQKILQLRSGIRFFIILEPEPGILIQALKYMDLEYLLSNKRVILGIVPEDPAAFLAPAQKAIAFEDTQIIEHPVIFSHFIEKYQSVRDRLFPYINRYNIAGATRMIYGVKLVGNRFDHLKSLGHFFLFESLIDQFKDMPAYIVAGGPSLAPNIRFLKEVQGKAVILAVDSVLPALLDQGVVPDFMTSIDYQDITYEKIAHRIDDIPESLALITYTATTPVIRQNFPGKRTFYLFAEDGIDEWVNRLIGGRRFFASGPSVANLNFIAAKAMGCSPIIFVGQDLCYIYHQSHAKAVVLSSQDFVDKCIESGKDLSWVDTVNGERAPSTRDMTNIKDFFEEIIRIIPGDYINCSEGAHIEGTRHMDLEKAVTLYGSETMTASQVLDAVCSPEKRIGSKGILINITKDLQLIEEILALTHKVSRLVNQCRRALPGLKKSWRPKSVLPSKLQGLLKDIDAVNQRIDGHHKIWKILEEMTSKALQKSEQMAFQADRLKGIPQKYPEWLEKTIDRLVYVNTVRSETLEFLVLHIKKVMAHITEERDLLKETNQNLETVENLAALYIESRDYALARPFVETYYEKKKDSARANYFMGCLEAQRSRFDHMDAYFVEASKIDPSYEKQINKFRMSYGDLYFDSAAHFRVYEVKVAKMLLFKGIRFCPFHKQLHSLIVEIVDQELIALHEADAKNLLLDKKDMIQNWIQTIQEIPQIHSCLSFEHLGLLMYFQGKIQFVTGQKSEALTFFQKSVIYLPQDAGLTIKIADLFLCSFDYEQGLGFLNRAIDLEPGHASYWEDLGDYLYKNHKFDEAASAYEEAIRYFPSKSEIKEKIADSWLQKGNKLHQEGNFTAAEQAYEQGLDFCLDKSPLRKHLFNNIGSALQNIGKFESAMSAYDRALEIDDDYIEALHNKGVLLEILGDTEKAAYFLVKAKNLSTQG